MLETLEDKENTQDVKDEICLKSRTKEVWTAGQVLCQNTIIRYYSNMNRGNVPQINNELES
jgi:hypothetical protein